MVAGSVFLLVLAVLQLPVSTRGFDFNPPAVIKSPNIESTAGPLIFSAGTTVILTCCVKQHLQDKYAVNSLRMKWKPCMSACDLQEVNVTVSANYVSTTLHDATEGERVFYCYSRENGGEDTLLTSRTVRIGYPPGDNFTVSCQLYPGERLECCLVITDPRRLLDNPVPVTYSAEYGRVEAMEPFPEIWMDPDAGQKCVDYDLSEYDLSYLGTLMVRMNASNELGNRSSTVTFRPIDEVNPGHVTALQGHNLSNPNQIQITWSLAWSDIYPSTCKTMGGVYYDVIVKSLHPDVKQSMDKTFLDSNCTNRKMSYTATGLVPHTLYNITVTARSRTHRGQPASFNQTTSQGVPLVAPAVTAWAYSDGDTSDTVAIYWSKYTHEEKGGDIISYDVIVNGTFVVVRVKDKLHTSDGQLVTTPSRPLSGCGQGCEVQIRARTVRGLSPVTEVRIPPKSAVDPGRLSVYVEKNASKSHLLSWEGSANVSSVHWCFGVPYDEDSSLIRCLTELREKDVEYLTQTSIPKKELHSEELSGLCENCNWHFAVGFTSANATDPARLVWAQCHFQFNGEAPVPQIKVERMASGITVQLDSACGAGGVHDGGGRPVAAEITYSAQSSHCSLGISVNATHALKHGQGLTLNSLEPGTNYSICARLQSRSGWGEWKRVWARTESLQYSGGDADGMVVPMAVGLGIAGFIVLVIGFFVCQRCMKSRYGPFLVSVEVRKFSERKSRADGVYHKGRLNTATVPPPLPEPRHSIPANHDQRSDPAIDTDSDSARSSLRVPDTRNARSDETGTLLGNTDTLPNKTGTLLDKADNDLDKMNTSPDRTGTLPDGSGTLLDGSGTLPDGTGILPDGTGSLPDGTGTLPDGTGTLPDRTGTLPDGTGTLPDRTGTLPDRRGTLPDGTGTLPDWSGTLPDGTGTPPDDPWTAQPNVPPELQQKFPGKTRQLTNASKNGSRLNPGYTQATVVPGRNDTVVYRSNATIGPGSNSIVVPGSNSTVVPGSNCIVVPGSNATVVPGPNAIVVPGSNSAVVPGSNSTVVPGFKTGQPTNVLKNGSRLNPGYTQATVVPGPNATVVHGSNATAVSKSDATVVPGPTAPVVDRSNANATVVAGSNGTVVRGSNANATVVAGSNATVVRGSNANATVVPGPNPASPGKTASEPTCHEEWENPEDASCEVSLGSSTEEGRVDFTASSTGVTRFLNEKCLSGCSLGNNTNYQLPRGAYVLPDSYGVDRMPKLGTSEHLGIRDMQQGGTEKEEEKEEHETVTEALLHKQDIGSCGASDTEKTLVEPLLCPPSGGKVPYVSKVSTLQRNHFRRQGYVSHADRV